MPSFDVVSEVDLHEVTNAVDQAGREVATRFDFKGTESRFEREAESVVRIVSESEFQVRQMLDILRSKLVRRGVDIACLEVGEPEPSGRQTRMEVTIRQGIDADLARRIVRLVKDSRLKVQAAVQGDQVRVTGKKRDDLQAVMASLRAAELSLPLQFTNFRD